MITAGRGEPSPFTDEQVELARRQATLAHACADPRTEDLARAGLQMATTAESRLERSRCQGLLAVCLAKRGEAEDAERLLLLEVRRDAERGWIPAGGARQ